MVVEMFDEIFGGFLDLFNFSFIIGGFHNCRDFIDIPWILGPP
jgi:hypothetical protein